MHGHIADADLARRLAETDIVAPKPKPRGRTQRPRGRSWLPFSTRPRTVMGK